MVPHREYPADHKCHEDSKTRCAEAGTEKIVVDSKLLWYGLFIVAFPFPTLKAKRVCAERLNMSSFLKMADYRSYKKHETIAAR